MTAPTVASADPADRPAAVPSAAPVLLRPQTAPDLVVVDPARKVPAPRRRLRPAAERAFAVLAPRWPLLLALAVVTVLASWLIMSNTAFVDEATYLSAGRAEWAHLLHGASIGQSYPFSGYFSGSPLIYPPLVAAANAVGGLALARALSLAFMLFTVTLLYATTNRLFDRRAAGWSAAIFATTSGTQFLAAFATYDGMALMLVALAAWVGIRYAQSDRQYPHAGLFLAVPALALANATKYATGLFDPVVIVVIALVVLDRYGRREAARIAAIFTAMMISVLCAAVAMAGQNYEHGISTTTLSRAAGGASVASVLDDSVKWIGWLALLSLAAIIACLISSHRHRRPADRGWRRLTASQWLVVVLAATVALAPLQHARIHTTLSLNKHVTFGAWFAAIAVGALLARVSGRKLRAGWRWVPVLAAASWLTVGGYGTAHATFSGWADKAQLMASIKPYVAASADKPVLMDEATVASYYLGSNHPNWRWTATYGLTYTPAGSSTMLSGTGAYRAAIRDGVFGLIAIDDTVVPDVDKAIETAANANPDYQYLGAVQIHTNAGPSSYKLWLDTAPAVTS